MKNNEAQKISIHIRYNEEMTIYNLQDSLQILQHAFSEFYEKEKIRLSDSNVASPKVTSVSKGSIVIDVIVPIACALIPVVYDIINKHFSNKDNYIVDVKEIKIRWSDEDNYRLSRAVLEEYAIKKSDKAISDFIDELAQILPYKKESVRAKIQNTKQLLLEKRVSTTLSISSLSNYSDAHKAQFERACVDLNV